MFPVLFYSKKEINLLKGHIDSRVKNWLKKYTLTTDLDIEISRAKFNDFDHLNGIYLDMDGNRISVKFYEENFSWEKLIFSSLSHLCPRDSVLLNVITSIKKAFLKDIFDLSISEDNLRDSARSVFDAYLKIRISGKEIGDLTFFASDSIFSSYVERKERMPIDVNLERVRDAAASINVPLTFSLNFGNVQFLEILKMDVGNIIVSSHQLENKVSVALCNSSTAVASIGKKNNELAFILKS